MQKICVLLELTESEKEQFRTAAGDNEILFLARGMREFIVPVDEAVVADADVIIGQVEPKLLKSAGKLKWLQTRSSGVDTYTEKGVMPEGAMLTSATGAYGTSVAEHVFALMLDIMKRLPVYRDNQHQSLWRDEGNARSPEDANILILGTGNLGSEFAKYCKAFGAHTVGVRRNPAVPAEGIDEMHGMDELDKLITEADVVCSLIPHAEEMVGYFNYERFMSMKPDAIFLNAGRGTVVDSDGLNRAISEGHLFGAGLDTTAPEPLPADHPLWKQKNVVITPHSAGDDHLSKTMRKVAAIALDNLKRYIAGKELVNRKI